MKMDAEHLIARLSVVRRRAQSLAQTIDELEADLHAALATQRKEPLPGPLPDPVDAPQDGCRCPPNQRVAAATHGNPRRTVCRLCQKEHD